MQFLNEFHKFLLVFFLILTISFIVITNQFALAIDIDQNVQKIVDSQKILLDSDTEILYEVKQSGKTYYVVRYNNALPYANGLEVISKDGTKISNSNTVKSIFTSMAWGESAKKLTTSDISTLNSILSTSNKINNVVSPVYSTTSSVIDKVDWLKTQCIGVSFAKVCAWDAVKTGYPQISQLESAVRLLNNELSDWNKASTDVSRNLPNAISGLEKLRKGGDLNPTLQNDIEKSLSSFSKLKSKTNQMVDRLSGITTTLSSAERSLKSLSNKPLVGNMIFSVGEYIGNLNNQVISLKNEAQTFSNTLTTQSQKLVSVTDFAEQRSNELLGLWNARQNAATSVYATIIGLFVIISIIVGIIIIFSKKRKVVVKQATVSKPKFCRKCGAPSSTSGKFCRKCGTLI